MTQEPDPTTPDSVAYVKQWIQWAKDRIKATREATQSQVTTLHPTSQATNHQQTQTTTTDKQKPTRREARSGTRYIICRKTVR